MANKVTNLTLPSGETVEIQDSHAVTLDENIDIQGTFDFGKITGYGNYNVPANALNAPSDVSVSNGVLKVIYDHDKPIQVYLHRVTNQVFVRSLRDNGSWSEWEELTANSNLQNQINSLNTKLTSEVANRQNGDSTLQSAINTEKTARSNADTTLQNNINTVSSNLTKETNARASAETIINGKIESLQSTVSTQTESIKIINNSISTLNSLTEWKLHKQVTGQVTVTLPTDWHELYIGVNFTSGIYYTFYIPKIFTNGSTGGFSVVNTYPSDSDGYCNIHISPTDYRLVSCTSEKTPNVSNAISFIYYR